MSEEMRISEAAKLAGVSTRTLRYYEELGLLTPSAHTPGGERRYLREDVLKVKRIRELKELLGFNLDEIREVLDAEARLGTLREQYHASASGGPHRKAVARQIAILYECLEVNRRLSEAVDRKLASVQSFRKELSEKESRYRQVLCDLEKDTTGQERVPEEA